MCTRFFLIASLLCPAFAFGSEGKQETLVTCAYLTEIYQNGTPQGVPGQGPVIDLVKSSFGDDNYLLKFSEGRNYISISVKKKNLEISADENGFSFKLLSYPRTLEDGTHSDVALSILASKRVEDERFAPFIFKEANIKINEFMIPALKATVSKQFRSTSCYLNIKSFERDFR